ncbi:MAG: hypothetical protein WC887_03110 [Candidatus Paceibacterota bacterium]|jgi:hypothetical protein
MYKVIIALKEVAQAESLAEACQLFIMKTKEMLLMNVECSEMVLLETCMIQAEIDGVKCTMNFDAIMEFSHAAGILNENGKLRDKPAPYIPKDFAQEVFLASYSDSVAAFVAENAESFAQIVAEVS